MYFVQGRFLKATCCCTVGRAWGETCEDCPRPGSEAYEDLCPKGFGFVNRKDINECTEYPDMCENGRCRNSIGSFSCRCNQGYALDEDGVKCVGMKNVEQIKASFICKHIFENK